jgi:hypothetical protein
MIENYIVNHETYEATGTFEGQVFAIAPKLVNNVLVAVSEVECIEILRYRQQADSKIAEGSYKVARAAEYPPITDYLDAVVKGDQAQIDAYVAACLAVKAKYPKPNN